MRKRQPLTMGPFLFGHGGIYILSGLLALALLPGISPAVVEAVEES